MKHNWFEDHGCAAAKLYSDVRETVKRLRTNVVSRLMPLENAPNQVLAALHHMVGKFRSNFVGDVDWKPPQNSHFEIGQTRSDEVLWLPQPGIHGQSKEANYMTFDEIRESRRSSCQ